MDIDEAGDILRMSSGQVVRIGSPLARAIEFVLAYSEKYADLYDAREAEVLELLRERNAIRRRARQVRDEDWASRRIADFIIGDEDEGS